MKKYIVLAFVLVVLAVSCSKEQKTVNKLEGTWKATSVLVDAFGITLDVPITEDEYLFTFYDCKVKDGNCDGQTDFNGDLDNFTYTIGGEGTTIETVDSVGNPQIIEILELEKETFKIEMDLGIDSTGTPAIVTFARQS